MIQYSTLKYTINIDSESAGDAEKKIPFNIMCGCSV